MALSRETLHKLIDLIDEKDITAVYQMLMNIMIEGKSVSDGLSDVEEADVSAGDSGLIDRSNIDWEYS